MLTPLRGSLTETISVSCRTVLNPLPPSSWKVADRRGEGLDYCWDVENQIYSPVLGYVCIDYPAAWWDKEIAYILDDVQHSPGWAIYCDCTILYTVWAISLDLNPILYQVGFFRSSHRTTFWGGGGKLCNSYTERNCSKQNDLFQCNQMQSIFPTWLHP